MELKEFTLKEFFEKATTQDTIDFIKFLNEKHLIGSTAILEFIDYQKNENKKVKDIDNAARKILDNQDRLNILANLIALVLSANTFLNTFDEYDLTDEELNKWVSEFVGKKYAKQE
jgi:uncharacterized protein YeeX (DUF496 family)